VEAVDVLDSGGVGITLRGDAGSTLRSDAIKGDSRLARIVLLGRAEKSSGAKGIEWCWS